MGWGVHGEDLSSFYSKETEVQSGSGVVEAGPCTPQRKMYIAYCMSTGELSRGLSYVVNKEITLVLLEGGALGLRGGLE